MSVGEGARLERGKATNATITKCARALRFFFFFVLMPTNINVFCASKYEEKRRQEETRIRLRWDDMSLHVPIT